MAPWDHLTERNATHRSLVRDVMRRSAEWLRWPKVAVTRASTTIETRTPQPRIIVIVTVVALVLVGWFVLGVVTVAVINVLQWFVRAASQRNDSAVAAARPGVEPTSVPELPSPAADTYSVPYSQAS